MQSCDAGHPCLSFVKYFISLTLLTLIIFLGSLTYYFIQKTSLLNKPTNVRDTFNMGGHGELSAIPDIALVNAGLETTLKNVGDAQRENTEKMNAFLKKVGSIGIKDTDRKTTSYSIYPKYDYLKDENGNFGKQIISGYTVNNQVQLKVRDLSRVSDVLNTLGEFGLNQVGGFSFSIDDDKELKQQALELAIKNARAKAERLAKTAGIRLGRMVSFSESSPSYPPAPYRMYEKAGVAMDSAAPMAPTVEKGSQMVEVDIQATYELLP